MIRSFLLLLLTILLLTSCTENDSKSVTPETGVPLAPSLPVPSDSATQIATPIQLRWTCSDPDTTDTLRYDVQMDTINPPQISVAHDLRVTNWTTGILRHGKTYFWKIIAKDLQGHSVAGPAWRFTTVGNNSPLAPSNPVPADSGSAPDSASVTLRWHCSDPDRDTLRYTVYFGTTNPPTTATASNLSDTTAAVTNLHTGVHYYWYVVASDEQGGRSQSSVWNFTISQFQIKWGPDGYGYTATDNRLPYWPTAYRFRDITSLGTEVIYGDDIGASTSLNGMPFRFYGDAISDIFVSTNGNVQFVQSGSSSLSNSTLPSLNVPSSALFALWDDLMGQVFKFHDVTENVFYIQWNGRRLGGVAGDTTSFQIQLHSSSNEIVFAYSRILDSINSLTPTIGIQHNTGANNQFLQCFYITTAGVGLPNPMNGYMIRFCPPASMR